jgi:hypothetical protein
MNPARSAIQARSIIVRFLARSLGEDGARAQVGGMKVADVVSAITVVDDDRPDEFRDGMPVVDPKGDAGGRSTT